MERERHINDLKKIASISRNKKNVKTQSQRNLLGKNVIKAIQGIGCKPHEVFYKPGTNFSVNGSLSSRKGLRKIGKGQMGEVFLGCIDKECEKPVAIKVSNDPTKYEYKIGKRIEKLSGTRMYAYQKCDKYSIIYTEYANSGNLTKFVKDNAKTLRPIHLRTIVTHILYNLYRIHRKYPSFRHHDLHTENVLINTNVKAKGIRRFKIDDSNILKVHDIGIEASLADFGFSSISGIPNPEIDSGEFKSKYGIYRESNYMYDVHFFLNSVRQLLKTEGIYVGAETIQFIERILPSDYLGLTTYKINNYRLRTGPTGHGSLPTFKQIFKDRYFSPYREKKQELTKILDIIGRTPIQPKSIIVKHGGHKPQPKVSLSKSGYVKIGTRKCESYKKSELIKIANSMNIQTKDKTIAQICQSLKIKYIK
jgi:hypothetical protein